MVKKTTKKKKKPRKAAIFQRTTAAIRKQLAKEEKLEARRAEARINWARIDLNEDQVSTVDRRLLKIYLSGRFGPAYDVALKE